MSSMHLTHSANTELGDNRIAAEESSSGERHPTNLPSRQSSRDGASRLRCSEAGCVQARRSLVRSAPPGVTFESPFGDVPGIGLKVALLIDPAGTRIELTEGLARR